jgi:hypothetical protein
MVHKTPSPNKQTKWTEGKAQMVECYLCKCKLSIQTPLPPIFFFKGSTRPKKQEMGLGTGTHL